MRSAARTPAPKRRSSRNAAVAIASHVPVDRPHLSFVNGTVQSALATLDRVATVGTYAPSVTYPNTGLGQAMKAVAGAMVRQIGTKVFWVQTGGFDTHASQGAAGAGAYAGLMKTVDDAVLAFYNGHEQHRPDRATRRSSSSPSSPAASLRTAAAAPIMAKAA